MRRDLVLPELASAYAGRAHVRPGMHLAGGPAVTAFEGAGWTGRPAAQQQGLEALLAHR